MIDSPNHTTPSSKRLAQVKNGDTIENTIVLSKHEASEAQFKQLYRYGMSLIEETAFYIDGEGKRTSDALSPEVYRLYKEEAMRLSTRLMQIAAWLLLCRAGRDKEMSEDKVMQEKAKLSFVISSKQKMAKNWSALPAAFRQLVENSLRLEERIRLLDQDARTMAKNHDTPPIVKQFDRLKEAFEV